MTAGSATPQIGNAEAATVTDIANLLLEADEAWIAGVLPIELGRQLVSIAHRVSQSGKAIPLTADSLFYVTPAQDLVSAYRLPMRGGPLLQEWYTGLTGIRNVQEALGGLPLPQTTYPSDLLQLDCVVLAVGNDSLAGWIMTGSSFGGDHLIARLPDQSARVVLANQRDAVANGSPLRQRQLLCKAPPGPERSGTEFIARLEGLYDYGLDPPPNTVVPVAVVLMMSATPDGPAVLLKLRTETNSRNDFGTLSLLSERLIEEDLAPGAGLSQDRDRAMEQLWISHGKPLEVRVSNEVFVRAAQRELFTSCGLDLEETRFIALGTQLVPREGSEIYIGFQLFAVVLERTHELDELDLIRYWDSDIRVVDCEDLYMANAGAPLNRLLRTRQAWIEESIAEATDLMKEFDAD